jgi:hypothetical protein
LKRLLLSKAGLVVVAFRKMQTLPQKPVNGTAANKFEKGLSTFIDRTLRKTFSGLKSELE